MKKGEGLVSQMSKKHQESQVFVPVHPLARAFGENSVKLLSQVYWSPGLLEREVIYPSVIGKSWRLLAVQLFSASAAITANMTTLLQSAADGRRFLVGLNVAIWGFFFVQGLVKLTRHFLYFPLQIHNAIRAGFEQLPRQQHAKNWGFLRRSCATRGQILALLLAH